jgi:hypothetical protein
MSGADVALAQAEGVQVGGERVFRNGLSLVAEHDGQIVGHVMFTCSLQPAPLKHRGLTGLDSLISMLPLADMMLRTDRSCV